MNCCQAALMLIFAVGVNEEPLSEADTGDYAFWRVDLDISSPRRETASPDKLVLSRFDLGDLSHPAVVPVSCARELSLPQLAHWGKLSAMITTSRPDLDRQIAKLLPHRTILGGTNYGRGVLSQTNDGRIAATFGIDLRPDSNATLRGLIDYRLVDTTTGKRLYRGRFAAHSGEAEFVFVNAPGTLGYFVKRPAEGARAHSQLIRIRGDGTQEPLGTPRAWAVAAAPVGDRVLLIDFEEGDEGKGKNLRCTSVLELRTADLSNVLWRREVVHSGVAADAAVLCPNTHWSLDGKRIMFGVERESGLWFLLLDSDTGNAINKVRAPFRWVSHSPVTLASNASGFDPYEHFGLEKRDAASYKPAYEATTEAAKVGWRELTDLMQKTHPDLAERLNREVPAKARGESEPGGEGRHTGAGS